RRRKVRHCCVYLAGGIRNYRIRATDLFLKSIKTDIGWRRNSSKYSRLHLCQFRACISEWRDRFCELRFCLIEERRDLRKFFFGHGEVLLDEIRSAGLVERHRERRVIEQRLDPTDDVAHFSN